jgi:hypothetical protein
MTEEAAGARTPIARIVLSWLMAIAGVVWAWIISLASAMKTVPSMSLGAALMTLPIPLLAAALAATVAADVRRGAAPRTTLWLIGPVFALVALAVLIGVGSYFGQP